MRLLFIKRKYIKPNRFLIYSTFCLFFSYSKLFSQESFYTIKAFGRGAIGKDTVVFLNPLDSINIPFDKNNLLIYIKNNQKIISYKLEGLDNQWIKVSNPEFIYLTNLIGGNYILYFRNESNIEQKTLNIRLESPFWAKWWFVLLVVGFIFFFLGLIVYFIFLYRLRQQLRLQAVRHELEIKALRAQMNPHFIFNSMNTIDAYILRRRFVEASDCLQKFSKLIRQILENSENQTISISAELETLRLYIELEQERFSHSFSYVIDIEPALLEKEYQIPPLLIQPFVENAILHGIRHLTERKGEILVKLFVNSSSPPGSGGEVLFCQIQDNGIGRKASSEINQQRQENHKSMGVDITMERIATYQALYGSKMETNIIDLEEGTMIEIKLPLIDTNL